MRYRLNGRLYWMAPGERLRPGDSLIEIMTKQDYASKYNMLVHDHLLLKSMENIHYCKVDLLQKCIIGTFLIPGKFSLNDSSKKCEPEKNGSVQNVVSGRSPVLACGFYMDQEKLIFIDDSGTVSKMLHEIEQIQIIDKTYVAHFLFEFMEYLIKDEVEYLQGYEEQMNQVEEAILTREAVNIPSWMIARRKELMKLGAYYNQLLDMGDTMAENYNNLLNEEDCRLFKMFADRVTRLYDYAQNLREYALQIREMYQTQIDIRQNNVMRFLTVVTTIFMPLTLIVGWYGMNFVFMPETQWKYGYPAVIAVSAVVILLEIWYFKKKKWF